MINRNRPNVAWRHDYADAKPWRAEQPFGKVVGQPDAAVRCGVSRKRSTVERDARPSEALHVRHEGIVIEVGVVLDLFLEDAEDTGWRLAALLAARHWRSHDPAFVIVNRDLLVAQRNDCHDWLASRTHCHRLFIPKPCGIRNIVRRYQSSQAGKGNCNAQSRLFVLLIEDIKFHVAAI